MIIATRLRIADWIRRVVRGARPGAHSVDSRDAGRVALLEAAIEGSRDGFWAWDAEADPPVWYSAGALEIFRRDADEIAGTVEEWQSWLHLDDVEPWRKALLAPVEDARPYDELELRVRRGDGQIRRILFRAVFDLDEDGARRRVSGLLRDVTEDRAAEAELEQSRRMLQAVLDSIPVRVFWKALDNSYIGCNSSFAQDAGVESPAAIFGKTDHELAWTDQAELYRADDQQVMRTGVAKLNYEEPQLRPDGSTAWLRTSKVPLVDAAGEVNGVLGCYEDITAQKNLEEELRQAQKLEAVGQLAGGIAHDFNNVLTIILGTTDSLEQDLEAEGSLQSGRARDLGDIREAAKRAAAITHKLLAFSRREVVAPQVITFGAVVRELEPMLRSLLGDHVRLSLELAEREVPVLMDPRQLEQVILNLVINARDALSNGGSVRISTGRLDLDEGDHESLDGERVPGHTGLHASLDVFDDGVGIETADLEHVFEPFFTTKPIGSGTGLGLSTVHGIVTASGGLVRVSSSPEQGSRFTILMPASHDEAGREEQSAPTRSATSGSETILLCEDDVAIRRLTKHALVSRGYTVLEAQGARHALSLAGSFAERIHLVLTDVIMPEMNGREVAEAVTQARPDCRVLYISGYTANIIAERGVPLEGASFLEKPFTPDQLAERVRLILDEAEPR